MYVRLMCVQNYYLLTYIWVF